MNREDFMPEQREVLDSQGKNLIVSASAGSGKTTVMIQKIIEDIDLRGVDLKKILVVTYTSASADEMKQKLANALYDRAGENPNCIRQIDDLATADISTIHSFFQKIIKRYFNAIDINPDFSIADESLIKKFEEKALELAIDDFGEHYPEKLEKVMDIFGKSRNDKTLKKLILKLNTFLKSLESPKEWQENIATSLYNLDTENNPAFKIVNNKLFETSRFFVEKFRSLQRRCQNLGLDYFVDVCNGYLSMFEGTKRASKYFFENIINFNNLPDGKLKKEKQFPNETKELEDLVKASKKYCEKIKKWNFTFLVVEKSMKVMPEIIHTLLDLTNLYRQKFSDVKTKANTMDYDDLEKYMLEILQHENIRNEIIESYSSIYVDEYQDANRVQEKIFRLICKPNNRFMVGDVKQSIYRFRQAEPDIFLENQAFFAKDPQSDVKFLNCNFRSEKSILDFVNIIFGEIMTKKTAKIDYKNTSNLDGQAKYQKVEELSPVEIVVLRKTKEEKKPEPTEIYRMSKHKNSQKNYTTAELEAFVVASKIRDILGKKIYIPSQGVEKNIEFSDITILLKGRGSYLAEFCSVLSKFQIPIYANTNKPLYDDSDIQILLNLLTLCVNENNDIELVAVLHSVFGNLSFNELAKIRLACEDKKATFYQCAKAYNKDDEIAVKLKAFFNMLSELRLKIKFTGIFYALNKVINKYNFNSYLLAKSDGLEKVEKVKKFLNDFLTNNFDNNLIDFIDYAMRNKDDIKSPNFANGENCVNVTTIHSSKGLEFPIVFLVNAGQDLNKEPDEKSVQFNAKLGIGLNFFDFDKREKSNSVVLEAILNQNQDENFAEKLRLLYVALTRPKNHLIVVGTAKKAFEKITSDFDVMRQNSYLNLIINSLSKEEIAKINNGESVKNEKYSVEVIDDKTEVDFMEVLEKRVIPPLDDAEKMDKILKYFHFKYPHPTDITSKNSVSSILKAESPYVSSNASPQSLLSNEHNPISFSDLGTAYHSVLEEVDFESATLEDLEEIVRTRYGQYKEQIDVFKIMECIGLLRQFDLSNILKEQKFVMNIPHSEVVEEGSNDEILVQGIVDLLILGEKNILIDYKLSNQNDDDKLIKKYELQLQLYKKATENALNVSVDETYILHINKVKLIKVF